MSGSDLKYRSTKQLQADVSFNRKRANEHTMRADAADMVLSERLRVKEQIRSGALKLYPYQEEAVKLIRERKPVTWVRGMGVTIIMAAVDIANEGEQ